MRSEDATEQSIGDKMTKANNTYNTRKPGEECWITDVDRDREEVYVYFGEFGQAAYRIEEDEKIKIIVDTLDSLEVSDTLRIDAEAKWTLREIDSYFYERIGASVDDLVQEDEQLAKNLGRWFSDYRRGVSYDST